VRRITPIVAAALLWLPVMASTATEDSLSLSPSMEQRYASNLATRFLTNWHYKDTRLDDELSSKIFDSYLELLDPNKSYFLGTDIEMFERYRPSLDDALRHNDLQPAYEIFNIYTDRVKERVAYARARVQEPFDFEIDEKYLYNREDEDWPASPEELQELWRMRVKNDYLRLKLTDKEETEIIKTLTERYDNLDRRINELKPDDVFQFFMNAFATSIEPHTAYLSPRTSENFEISMKLSLEGIGALLGRETEYTTISRVVPGGPADKDGRLKAGDRITAVGQDLEGKMVDVIGWRVDDVVDLIRGPKHTVVRLEVLPADESITGQTTIIDIVRNEVKLEEQAAKNEIIEIPVGGKDSEEVVKIGIIDLPVFYIDFNGRAENRPDYRSSTRDVRKLIGELEEQGVQGIVVDLRNNGGGSLLEATTLTGLFIDQGPVVQVRSANGRISQEEDTEPGMAWSGPMAVLVNRYSASASEIFAAAIQDYGRGLVIGEPTFGKGTVQSLVDLDDYAPSDSPGMGQLKITMAQFFRVNGGSTQNRGVIPDIRFPSTGDPEEYGESALKFALPWTSIDAAPYAPVSDLSTIAAVADNLYQGRADHDREFAWLQSDIEEYNEQIDSHEVSLMESVRRANIAEEEEKRAKRKAERDGNEPLLNEESVLAEATEYDPDNGGNLAEAIADEEDAGDADAESGPDLLLRESARIVADIVELEGDIDLLNAQFTLLNPENEERTLN
jgi:carboxyl-terminal processing protease